MDNLGHRVGTLFTLGFTAVGVIDQTVAFRIADLDCCSVARRSLLSRGEVDCDVAGLQ